MVFGIFPALLSIYLIVVLTFIFVSAHRNLGAIVHAMHTQSCICDIAHRFQKDCIQGLQTACHFIQCV